MIIPIPMITFGLGLLAGGALFAPTRKSRLAPKGLTFGDLSPEEQAATLAWMDAKEAKPEVKAPRAPRTPSAPKVNAHEPAPRKPRAKREPKITFKNLGEHL